MAQFDALLKTLGTAAQQLAGRIVPGAPALIEAGKSLAAAYTTLKRENGGTAPREADAGHDTLFQKVKAHADRTLGRLEGK